mgnify:CR=1 FL=1
MQTRLQRKQEKDKLKQAVKYLALTLTLLFLLIKFGLPWLVNLVAFWGRLKTNQQPIEIEQKLITPPKLDYIPEATNSSSLNISGWSQPETTIKLYIKNINVKETISDRQGWFEFKNIHLAEGESEIYVEATDNQGNLSQPSNSLLIIVDSQKPEISLNQPKENERFFDKDNPITISGQTEPNSKVTVNGRFAMINNEGRFEVEVYLTEGDNQLEIISLDQAGNETRKNLTVSYTP